MTRHPGMVAVRRAPGSTREIEADLCVVGSGAAGLSAALEARALGLDVVIADASPQLGGQAVESAIGTICGLYANGLSPHRVTYGAMDEMLAALTANGDATARRARNTLILDYSINAWMRWAEDAVADRGVTPLTGAILREVTLEDGRVAALDLATRWGDVRIRANAFVDASGDAALTWLTGQEMYQADAPVHGTVMAVFEDVDTDLCGSWPRERFHDAMKRRGAEFGLVRHDGFIFPVARGGRVLLNMTHIETPQDAAGLALAGIAGRRQVDGLLALFRDEFPDAFGKARVALYGQPGIRQTRTIRGRSRITVEDVRTGHRPDDVIARCSWPIELHTEMADTHWEVFDEDHMHHIPFGAMVPEGLDNVVVAGRCIDAEPAALASVRVMGPCFAMGRAAASAAARLGSGSFHQIDIAGLQADVADNLDRTDHDPWTKSFMAESGREADGA
ncbi:MAG: FAD-dependent oxidoreductase [Minwuia sp.]|uniref:FAD-dependent oxidoreductase n=1 Tax=Minwuia sp. TaxID=2493630 RepID=UPI003A844E7C